MPTIEHSLSVCDACNCTIWIGPQQLQMVNSPFIQVRKLCLYCVSDVQRVLQLQPREVDINIELRNARRRTA